MCEVNIQCSACVDLTSTVLCLWTLCTWYITQITSRAVLLQKCCDTETVMMSPVEQIKILHDGATYKHFRATFQVFDTHQNLFVLLFLTAPSRRDHYSGSSVLSSVRSDTKKGLITGLLDCIAGHYKSGFCFFLFLSLGFEKKMFSVV